MLISLIVPIYNVKQYFEEFINSVERQTFLDFQVVLVDDGSNDGTEELVDKFKDNSRYKIIHKTNGGVVSAWKRGVEEADGEYLAFADPDDILDCRMMECFQSILQQYNPDMIISGYYDMYAHETICQPPATKKVEEKLYTGEELQQIKKNLFGDEDDKTNFLFFVRWNKLFRKKLFVDNLQYTDDRIKLGDDVCATAAAVYDSQSIYFLRTPLYYYRRREGSITTISFKSEEIDNAVILIDCLNKLLSEKGFMTEFICFKEPAWHIVYLLRKIIDGDKPYKTKKENLFELRQHNLVKTYDIKAAKKYISAKQYWAIVLLKSKMYAFLIFLGKKSSR